MSYQIIFPQREQAELTPAYPSDIPLAPDEVTGRTLATAISAGTELALYLSHDPATFPFKPGYAAVFQVEEVGNDVTTFARGDIAFCMGPHRAWQRYPVAKILKVPTGLAPEVAVFARLMSVSMTTLSTTAARPGETVLVTGLGPVGHLAAKLFATAGYRVLASDPVAARRDLLSKIPGVTTIPTIPHEDPSVTGTVSLVVECSGHEQAALDGCRTVRKGGEVVLVGVPWQRRTDSLYAHDVMHAVFHRYAVLRSGWEWELPLHADDFRPSSIFSNLALALDWLSKGHVSVDGLYEMVSPAEAQPTYDAIRKQQAQKLATVFDWTQLP